MKLKKSKNGYHFTGATQLLRAFDTSTILPLAPDCKTGFFTTDGAEGYLS
jgi:hypothetical protein